MTGFARAAGDAHGLSVNWEVKSVNGKSVELRMRVPSGFDRLEPAIRQAIQKKFSRGSFQAMLTVSRATEQQAQPVVNEVFLRDVAELAKRLEKNYGTAPATADGLLALRGVLEVPETSETEEEKAAIDQAIIAILDDALTGLEAARRSEGAALGNVLSAQLETIAQLTQRAEADPARDPANIRARLSEQVRLLMEASGSGLDEQRLHTEAMLLATKADIREELDRLKTHVEAARALLEKGGVVGRRLDFLAQEFNRESNTLCSKSNAASLTAIGLDLKAVVDQFREQVQNLE
ncbi:MAG: YicC family protein [Rhizobiaceae bacterium]|nr:YicC family protein [Rhizobiaceae bacterium]